MINKLLNTFKLLGLIGTILHYYNGDVLLTKKHRLRYHKDMKKYKQN